ncbi:MULTISPECIES: DUF6287 domain-containing protein [Lactococcus]|uniref:DUF6287 domain-containing protein n=2 Tax=Lactococcus petauri TaxID=1940789 RepID=A0AAJ2IV16_9LACT|nr:MULTISPECIES: DUF6287 domain-containing protein [Lactococcus]MCH1712143.1 DUF6287 domain-containing protein [Lactococcus petauri]MDT2526653.1 DUF6287 domain-containing protein [Lactococcus petauri]MDT2541186.1 DUF6287 domain-containing protein [Lactococcus petauri]MDT2557761.1 DUF6287 domain-containing protein [Lactococcus petauri]MDT2559906.1 DUF6287 domain-containing protein [Lactococcus petauri]
MKKLIILSGVALMSLTLVACSSEKASKTKSSEEKTEVTSQTSTTESSVSTESTKSIESETSSPEEVLPSSEPETTTEVTPDSSTEAQEVDLDEVAILNNDFTTLSGTWGAGNGNILIINPDHSATLNGEAQTITVDTVSSGQKVLNIRMATGVARAGAAIETLKVGEKNPYGDQSDTSKPRLLLVQGGSNSPAEEYFYRK